MPSRFSIGLATVVMLVVLAAEHRLALLQRGDEALRRSELDLGAGSCERAKGPLAPLYHSYLHDFHGFERLLHDDDAQSSGAARRSRAGSTKSQNDWDARSRRRFAISLQLWTTASRNRPSQPCCTNYQAERPRLGARPTKKPWSPTCTSGGASETTEAGAGGRHALSDASESADRQAARWRPRPKAWLAELQALEQKYQDALGPAC